MRVGFYQYDIKLRDKAYNLKKVEEALLSENFDLLLLPELFSTGYLYSSREDIKRYSEEVPNGESTKLLVEIARKKQAYVVGGVSEIENDKIYNTAVVAGPEGYIGKYRKIHLTRFESNLFDKGQDIKVFDLKDTVIGIAICYDSWYPELVRLLMKKGARIICHIANFGGPQSLDVIKIRALENMVYTITCNRIGTEKGEDFDATYRGESQIVSPHGEMLYKADDKEAIHFIDIDPDEASDKSNVMCDDIMKEMDRYCIMER